MTKQLEVRLDAHTQGSGMIHDLHKADIHDSCIFIFLFGVPFFVAICNILVVPPQFSILVGFPHEQLFSAVKLFGLLDGGLYGRASSVA